jgi:hypothetical protein
MEGGLQTDGDLDEAALQQVADTTGGRYFRAADAGQLQTALKDLPSTITVAHKRVDIAHTFAGIGGLLVRAGNRVVAVVEPGPPGPASWVRQQKVASGRLSPPIELMKARAFRSVCNTIR